MKLKSQVWVGSRVVWFIFALFLVANAAYLHRVPGLMGDEASEGENVYEKLMVLTADESDISRNVLVTGERSYIGPLIDYVRVPFVWLFGYTALSLRVVMLLFSVATFWLAWGVLRDQFGRWPGLFGLVFFSFSPVYLLYQRLGWTITLFPFFAVLIVWMMSRQWKTRWLWAGLAAGLGLANHIIFLATLAGVAAGLVFYWVLTALPRLREFTPLRESHERKPVGEANSVRLSAARGSAAREPRASSPWSFTWASVRSLSGGILQAIVGFWAGFGMQFLLLFFFTDDQGDPEATAQLFSERLANFFDSFQLYISGSSFAARYTGVEMTSLAMTVISSVLFVLGLTGVLLLWRKKAVWAWLAGGAVHAAVILYIIDRFTLRYFAVLALLVWLAAGLGVGALLEKLLLSKSSEISKASKSSETRGMALAVGGLSVFFMAWMSVAVLVPFLRTGGSVAEFSLGDRTNSANALVDVRGLTACVRGAGPVHSENIHIWNRLQYLSHKYPNIEVLPDDRMKEAKWVIHYREPGAPGGLSPGDLCPELEHFLVVRP